MWGRLRPTAYAATVHLKSPSDFQSAGIRWETIYFGDNLLKTGVATIEREPVVSVIERGPSVAPRRYLVRANDLATRLAERGRSGIVNDDYLAVTIEFLEVSYQFGEQTLERLRPIPGRNTNDVDRALRARPGPQRSCDTAASLLCIDEQSVLNEPEEGPLNLRERRAWRYDRYSAGVIGEWDEAEALLQHGKLVFRNDHTASGGVAEQNRPVRQSCFNGSEVGIRR